LNTLHLISFDIPYPANYGGVIDVFYKIKALHSKGMKIILHCFQYDDKEIAAVLNQYCEEVHYYPRAKSMLSWFSATPFIVQTRNDKALIERLCKDDYPILFEGLHCCYFLSDKKLQSRQKLLRTHNVEHQYYKHLAKNEKSLFKKVFFYTEAWKLKRFENDLQNANCILSISESDRSFFAQKNESVVLLNAFHANNEVSIQKGLGHYCLFHGNLSIEDNSAAASWLIKNIFAENAIEFIIAGKNPNEDLISYCKAFKNVQLVSNPSDNQLNDFIQNAQINILYSSQEAGVKLKLINVLFRGRHCLANHKTFAGSGLEMLVHKAEKAIDFRTQLSRLMNVEYTASENPSRKDILIKHFDNSQNIDILISLFKDDV